MATTDEQFDWVDELDWPEESMTLEDYQVQAMEFAFYPDTVLYPALGLCSEAGEVADKIKKHFRDGEVDTVSCEDALMELPLNLRIDLAKELGDVLFYVTALATDIGYDLEEIASINIGKLQDRKDRNVLTGSGDYR